MQLFGAVLISKAEYDDLKLAALKRRKVIECQGWFSGWQDLNHIWKYILDDVNFGGIERARRDYAIARRTNEYGTALCE